MSKFLLNLLVQISKSLAYSKIQFFIRKEILFNFRPNRPSGQPAHPAFRPRVAREPKPVHPAFWPRAARQAEPAHQAHSFPPPPSPSSLHAPAAPLPPLAPPHHGRCAAPLPHYGATAMNMPPSLTRSCAFTRT
jgi:hypothetical protein